MNSDWEERVRIRAYQIWECEGRPDGRVEQHSQQAEEELRAQDADMDLENAPEALPEQGVEVDPPRKSTGTGTVATGTVVDPDLAGTSR